MGISRENGAKGGLQPADPSPQAVDEAARLTWRHTVHVVVDIRRRWWKVRTVASATIHATRRVARMYR